MRYLIYVIARMALVASVAIPLGARPAEAFDVFPEHHSLMENEISELDRLDLIDSEYQSDFVTYLSPYPWVAAFHRADDAFMITIGSISNKRFLHHSRLKVDQKLLADLTFRFTYFTQRDLEVDQQHAIFEMIKDLSGNLAVAVYGEPSTYKRENDIGVALIYRPKPDHAVRLFHTWVDFTRQEHNDRPDFFVRGSEPTSFGIVGRCSGCLGLSRETFKTEFSDQPEASTSETTATVEKDSKDYLEYYARMESTTAWRFPSQDYEFGYERWVIGTATRFASGGFESETGIVYNLRAELSRKFQSYRPLTPSSPVIGASRTRRTLEIMSSAEIGGFNAWGKAVTLEPGLGWFHRRWVGDQAAFVEHRNLVPFAWIHVGHPNAVGARLENSVAIGYETTLFSSEGTPDLLPAALKASASEHRLNLRYLIPFENQSVFSLSLTADIDAVARGGEGGVFEGGNGHFRAFF